MDNKFQEYKQLDLSQINKEILKRWESDDTFHKSITTREGRPTFVFYEGPPSANGMPGIHHVMATQHKRHFLPLQNHERVPRTPQGRVGHPRAAR